MIGWALDRLLEQQRAIQLHHYGRDPGELRGAQLVDAIRTNVLALEDELHEVLAECGWKPWKQAGYGRVNRKDYINELADSLLFLFNLMLLQRVTGREMVRALRAAWKKNRTRVKNGY